MRGIAICPPTHRRKSSIGLGFDVRTRVNGKSKARKTGERKSAGSMATTSLGVRSKEISFIGLWTRQPKMRNDVGRKAKDLSFKVTAPCACGARGARDHGIRIFWIEAQSAGISNLPSNFAVKVADSNTLTSVASCRSVENQTGEKEMGVKDMQFPSSSFASTFTVAVYLSS